ncbi:AI-2E family transporter [Lactovum miscens]|uniref:Putative PurR-regulated permease PerM n=1 Tax=Lactovum miscens TaxID=190387 RepID=A0A841C7G3_9LACT|nr:AI-2E family transporter [Lactovum miscens]MBB5888284.1 putative PurR-regulated permease PerM [Lactovum miscens]
MFKSSKLFFWTVEFLAVAALLWLLVRIDWIFKPITVMFSAIFIPFLIAGFLYFVFDPLIDLLEQKLKIKRIFGIILSVLIVIGAYVLIALTVIPNVISQLTSLISTMVKLYPEAQNWLVGLVKSGQFKTIANQVDFTSALNSLSSTYTTILQNLLHGMTSSIGSIVNIIVTILLILLLVPIFFFYMLKDGDKILPFIKKYLLVEDKYNVIGLLEDLHKTISKYIFGVALDALFIFIMAMAGFSVIQVPYALIFALWTAVSNLIPYVGPYIGLTPLVLATVFIHPWMTLIAVIYMAIVQQVDGNIVYPRIVGGAVHVHPITVMVLMMVMGSLYGIIGMVIGVPLYAMVKEIVKFVVGLYRNIRKQRQSSIHQS